MPSASHRQTVSQPTDATLTHRDWTVVTDGDRIRIRPADSPEQPCAACAGSGVLALGLVAVGGILAVRRALKRRAS